MLQINFVIDHYIDRTKNLNSFFVFPREKCVYFISIYQSTCIEMYIKFPLYFKRPICRKP